MEMTKKEVYLGVGALVVIAASLGYMYVRDGANLGMFATSSTPVETAKVEEVPPMTDAMQQVLETSKGFQLLVSYTDDGFEPSTATVRVGDTVRFTNNSSGELWVSAAAVEGGTVYPRGGDVCGQSAFDSCVRLQPKEFWEFTFEKAGTWGYKNVARAEHEGNIVAQ